MALEKVAMASGRGATVARVLRDLVGADSRDGPVQEAVVRRAATVDDLGGRRSRESEGHRSGEEGECDSTHRLGDRVRPKIVAEFSLSHPAR